MNEPIEIPLHYATLRIWPSTRYVDTLWPDGKTCGAQREDNYENRQEAHDQGYGGADAIWRSLVEHELLHNLVSEWILDRNSPTLRHEAGAVRAPYWLRLTEEAWVIAFQVYVNADDVGYPLHPFQAMLPKWRERFRRLTAVIWQQDTPNQKEAA